MAAVVVQVHRLHDPGAIVQGDMVDVHINMSGLDSPRTLQGKLRSSGLHLVNETNDLLHGGWLVEPLPAVRLVDVELLPTASLHKAFNGSHGVPPGQLLQVVVVDVRRLQAKRLAHQRGDDVQGYGQIISRSPYYLIQSLSDLALVGVQVDEGTC